MIFITKRAFISAVEEEVYKRMERERMNRQFAELEEHLRKLEWRVDAIEEWSKAAEKYMEGSHK